MHSILTAGVIALALAAPGVARADGVCDDDAPPPETSQPFAAFGDTADYFLAPGGDFESDGSGWQLRNAAVVDGNEDLGVLPGSHSLELGDRNLLTGLLGSLASGASRAVSPPLCITNQHPAFRYMLRAAGPLENFTTSVRYRDRDGDQHEVEVQTDSVTTVLPGQWQPSEIQPLASVLPLDDFGGHLEVQIVFRSALNVGGGYQIDDLLIDPYRGH